MRSPGAPALLHRSSDQAIHLEFSWISRHYLSLLSTNKTNYPFAIVFLQKNKKLLKSAHLRSCPFQSG
jgi:hypothetical protein